MLILDHANQTALFAAVNNNHLEVIELLLKSGAHIQCRDRNVSS